MAIWKGNNPRSWGFTNQSYQLLTNSDDPPSILKNPLCNPPKTKTTPHKPYVSQL